MKQQSVEEMIELITGDPKEADYMLEQLTEEGPKHKQELNTLLISRVLDLVRNTEKRTGAEFELQDGFEFTTGKEDMPVIPVLMPLHIEDGKDPQVVADHIAQAPEHELIAFSIFLQAIEWVIKQKEVR